MDGCVAVAVAVAEAVTVAVAAAAVAVLWLYCGAVAVLWLYCGWLWPLLWPRFEDSILNRTCQGRHCIAETQSAQSAIRLGRAETQPAQSAHPAGRQPIA